MRELLLAKVLALQVDVIVQTSGVGDEQRVDRAMADEEVVLAARALVEEGERPVDREDVAADVAQGHDQRLSLVADNAASGAPFD